ncbi:MAG: ORF6N domain-containing protein, partial [Spirochaetia bacterium]|nr:ORF6N domain-containing protein [Spirochaetia bacterium]
MKAKLDHPIENFIFMLRNERVILANDLAAIYGVETRALNQAVKRNQERFPIDFVYQLSEDEKLSLRSQIVTLEKGKYLKYPPYAFSEHGAIMAAMILNSPQAISMSVYVIRAFIQVR